MKKGIKILLISILAIVVVLAIAGAIAYNMFLKDTVEVASLSVEKGKVQVDKGTGFADVTGDTALSLKDKVKTLDGTAVITLYESIIIQLEANTEVMIKELAEEKTVVRQESGSTWSKFTSVTGIKGYEVETPTTVATVRGTEFGVDEDNESVLVGEGIVGINAFGNLFDLKQFEKEINGKKGNLTAEDKAKMLAKAKKSLELLIDLRAKILDKHKELVNILMEQYQYSEGLDSFLAKIDSGEINDKDLIDKSPVKLSVVKRLVKLDDAIKDQKLLIQKIESLAV